MHALVKQYLENLGETVTFETFSLQDDHDGNGIYISQWNSAHPKPTPDQLEALRPEVEAEQVLAGVYAQRVAAYPHIGDQLDAIWKELNQRRFAGDNLVSEADSVLNKVLAVKAKYPKSKAV